MQSRDEKLAAAIKHFEDCIINDEEIPILDDIISDRPQTDDHNHELQDEELPEQYFVREAADSSTPGSEWPTYLFIHNEDENNPDSVLLKIELRDKEIICNEGKHFPLNLHAEGKERYLEAVGDLIVYIDECSYYGLEQFDIEETIAETKSSFEQTAEKLGLKVYNKDNPAPKNAGFHLMERSENTPFRWPVYTLGLKERNGDVNARYGELTVTAEGIDYTGTSKLDGGFYRIDPDPQDPAPFKRGIEELKASQNIGPKSLTTLAKQAAAMGLFKEGYNKSLKDAEKEIEKQAGMDHSNQAEVDSKKPGSSNK